MHVSLNTAVVVLIVCGVHFVISLSVAADELVVRPHFCVLLHTPLYHKLSHRLDHPRLCRDNFNRRFNPHFYLQLDFSTVFDVPMAPFMLSAHQNGALYAVCLCLKLFQGSGHAWFYQEYSSRRRKIIHMN